MYDKHEVQKCICLRNVLHFISLPNFRAKYMYNLYVNGIIFCYFKTYSISTSAFIFSFLFHSGLYQAQARELTFYTIITQC